jgi:hypothetical protein
MLTCCLYVDSALQDPVSDIRKTAAILAGKIAVSFPVSTWSDMMPPILQMLDASVQATHPTALEGALQATQRICEDSALKLALDDGYRPLDALIPRLLALTASTVPSIRIGALSSYNSLLYLLSPRHQSGSSATSAGRSRNESFADGSEDYSIGGGAVRGTSPLGTGKLCRILHSNLLLRLTALSACCGTCNRGQR